MIIQVVRLCFCFMNILLLVRNVTKSCQGIFLFWILPEAFVLCSCLPGCSSLTGVRVRFYLPFLHLYLNPFVPIESKNTMTISGKIVISGKIFEEDILIWTQTTLTLKRLNMKLHPNVLPIFTLLSIYQKMNQRHWIRLTLIAT